MSWGFVDPNHSALAAWIDQTVGRFPTPTDCVSCVPFMNQIATVPLELRQRTSVLPSPSKSPVPTIDHTVGAAFPTPADCVSFAPFISQTATLPLAPCPGPSLLPSPLNTL